MHGKSRQRSEREYRHCAHRWSRRHLCAIVWHSSRPLFMLRSQEKQR